MSATRPLDRETSGDEVAIFPARGKIAGRWIKSDFSIPEGDWQ